MKRDWQKLHETYLGNMTGGIYSWLADHLGVSTESLQALQIGFCPRVVFGGKNGKLERVSYGGWLSCPMRDQTAKIVGLSLRGLDDKKLTYPGSGLGCMYHVNPVHRAGDRGYSAGSHNWDRVADVGVACPVCNHSDGCLVSAEDPSDPKAVVCVRHESPRKLGLGWLHIRKESGILASASVLAPDAKVVVVEGWTDVAAAFDLGFIGVGKPNNIGGQSIVAELVRNRDVIIMGENDKKANGDWPGQVGASLSLKACLAVTPKARILFPPEHIKDLRVWKKDFGLTAQVLLDVAAETGQVAVSGDVIQDDRPLTIFRSFIKDRFQAGQTTLLRNWESSWYVYDAEEGRYVNTPEKSLISEFVRWSEPKTVLIESANNNPKPMRLKVTSGLWSSMNLVALGDGYLDGSLPQWINGKQGTPITDLICFKNGVLDVDAYLKGQADFLLPSSPDLFTVNALPFDFDPAALCPLWEYFRETSLGDDPAKIALLQEWLGYCMTTDMSQEKMLYMRGPTGTGKGTILEIIQALVGEKQTATPQIDELCDGFGLASLVGKLVCLIGDARDVRGMQLFKSLQVLLSITGRDRMRIKRKFMGDIEANRLTCRITVASNNFLNIPDTSNAMCRRLMFLEFQRKIEKPDITLKDRLALEVQGIAVWALEGLRRLRANGQFTVPQSSTDAMAEWKLYNNPMASFLAECTEIGPALCIGRDMMYDAWVKWAEAKRQPMSTKSQFFNDMGTLATHAITVPLDSGGRNELVYKGLTLTHDASRRYLGKP